MAEAARLENVLALINASTVTGPATFMVHLSAGSDAAELSLSVGGSEIFNLKALTNTSESASAFLHLGAVAATVTLTGTSAKAWGISKV